jgi:hypothetical protein
MWRQAAVGEQAYADKEMDEGKHAGKCRVRVVESHGEHEKHLPPT